MAVRFNSEMETAWRYFIEKGLTEAGAAGLMGNLYAESAGFHPNRVEFLCIRRLKEAGKIYTDTTYTEAVDDGRITTSQFLNPLPGRVYGYGLAQWTSPDRKKGLYSLCKSRGVSIADLQTQLDYIMGELVNKYSIVLQTLKHSANVRQSSNMVIYNFEQPADPDKLAETRYQYAASIYNRFKNENGGEKVKTTVSRILNIARAWIGYSEASGKHKKIIDVYNSHKPLARGYAVQPNDSWCDTFVSAVFIKASAVALIGGTECGVEEHIKIFKAAGIWIEDGTITPKPGDIIVYNWDQKTQPNDGYADHIGIVELVSGKTITTIEGNYKDAVGRRVIPVGWGYIRGYARPRYAAEAQQDESNVSDPQQKVYHVQAATYTDRKYADQLVLKLKSYGIDSYSYQKSGYWLVQAGAFASKVNADAMLKRLKDLGISGMIW